MNQNNKKSINTLKSPSKVTLIRSRSSDHLLSIHQKSISRKNNIQKNVISQLHGIKNPCLSQSKSTKSLKNNKKKTPVKNNQIKDDSKSSKKTKNKVKKNTQQSDSKTVKKSKNIVKINLSEQSFNSIQSGKKSEPYQYFLYQNTYIPIQNSAQRRFVYKIKQIQQRSLFNQKKQQSTADNFFIKPLILQKKTTKDTQIQTQKLQIIQFGTNTTPRVQQTISIQTQFDVKFKQDINKCFSQTLTDLQFLFLPDQNNFRGFSKLQKIHYRQLFETISKKIWNNGSQNLQQLTEDKIHILLYQRQCIQMGMIEHYPQDGFPTHVFSVMSYLTNLFSYAQINYKDQILERIQNIYGFGYQQRFSRILRGQSTKKKCLQILNQALFMELENQLFKQHDFGSQTVEKAVHIHNKILFDAANQELQKFKPFYQSKGQPFPWSINLGMTFFSIDQTCLHLLFKQIKQKVLLKIGYLCGIHIDYDEYKPLQKSQKHSYHIKKLKQQQKRMIQEQSVEINYSPDIQEQNIYLKNKISLCIFDQLIKELQSQMLQSLLFY